ncbi:MAG: oligopeptide:H+ symporter, partial [Legionellaceae bacterium]|nr:oligopeptide:H+ symporter [Legionellaceae bacterium]
FGLGGNERIFYCLSGLFIFGATMVNIESSKHRHLPNLPKWHKAFWVVWMVEFWERFGYYGVSAILPLYFVQYLGYSESQSFYVFGSFTAFVYGFVWIGGWLGDNYLGPVRTLILGAVILTGAYMVLAFANREMIFYALSGIVVGNTLFKANSGSLISNLYAEGDPALVGAMTFYYVAVNLGALCSMALTPMVMEKYGWGRAFCLSVVGLSLGLSYFIFKRRLFVSATQNVKEVPVSRLVLVSVGSFFAIMSMAQLLSYPAMCNWVVYVVVSCGFMYFLYLAFSLQGRARHRMIVAFILVLQGVLFHSLYNQMPTSITFFAVHHIHNSVLGFTISPAQYQVLNPLFIVLLSPLFVYGYRVFPATFVTQFCLGISLVACAFFVLALPQWVSIDGLASPGWLLLSYFFQSSGELLVSGLGMAMVTSLCPRDKSGFVIGIWFLSTMLAGPIGAWIGSLTTSSTATSALSLLSGMHIYGQVFLKIGGVTGGIALLMWMIRPWLNQMMVSVD